MDPTEPTNGQPLAAATAETAESAVRAADMAARAVDGPHVGSQLLGDHLDAQDATSTLRETTATLRGERAVSGQKVIVFWFKLAVGALALVALVGILFGGILLHNQQTQLDELKQVRSIAATLNECTTPSDPTAHPPTVHACSDRSGAGGFNFSVGIIFCEKTLPVDTTRDTVIACLLRQLAPAK